LDFAARSDYQAGLIHSCHPQRLESGTAIICCLFNRLQDDETPRRAVPEGGPSVLKGNTTVKRVLPSLYASGLNTASSHFTNA
jgi:hypothetical protein